MQPVMYVVLKLLIVTFSHIHLSTHRIA